MVLLSSLLLSLFTPLHYLNEHFLHFPNENFVPRSTLENQTDMISNTKEMTKVIENQMLINNKIKQMEESMIKQSFEDSNQSVDSNSDKNEITEKRIKRTFGLN